MLPMKAYEALRSPMLSASTPRSQFTFQLKAPGSQPQVSALSHLVGALYQIIEAATNGTQPYGFSRFFDARTRLVLISFEANKTL